MVDLLSILNQSASSLGAQTAYSATVSNNINNSNTPGYSRQRAQIESVLPAELVSGAYIGQGAILGSVTQTRDKFLESQLPAAFGQAASSAALSGALSSVTVLDPTGALPTSLGTFYSAIQALSQNPGDAGLRQAAVSAAQSLALAFNQTSAALSQARTGIDAQLSSQVGTVNNLSAQVATLNKQIQVAKGSGASPNDLLDARQLALDQLSTLTGATQVPDNKGNVSVILAGGSPLVVADKAATLSTLPDPSNGGHVALQIARLDGSGTTVLQGTLGGTLGGEVSARDGALKTASDQVDTLAFDFGNAINTVHAAGYGQDGVTGRNLFTLTATSAGAASSIAVASNIAANPTLFAAAGTTPAASGDGSNVLKLIATETQTLSSGQNPSGTVSNLIAQFGGSSAQATAVSAQDSSIQDHLTTLRESTSGVSVDDELVDLQKAQRAYEAIAKVITTGTAMLDALLQLP